MAGIVLWNPPERRISFVIHWDDGDVTIGPPLSADEVYCDLCNADVVVRPVPVIDGHALCLRCLHRVEPEWPKQVPFEVLILWKHQLDEWASE